MQVKDYHGPEMPLPPINWHARVKHAETHSWTYSDEWFLAAIHSRKMADIRNRQRRMGGSVAS